MTLRNKTFLGNLWGKVWKHMPHSYPYFRGFFEDAIDSIPTLSDANTFTGINTFTNDMALDGVLSSTSTISATGGILADKVNLIGGVGTVPTGVTALHFGDGRDITTVLTLTDVALKGAVNSNPTAGGNWAGGALVYTFPVGSHLHCATSYNLGFTIGTVTTDTPDVGIGSVVGTGAVNVLGGTAEFEDYVDGAAWAVALDGTLAASSPITATAGALTGISLNGAADEKKVHLNAADGWDAGVTGALTASGTIILKWTRM